MIPTTRTFTFVLEPHRHGETPRPSFRCTFRTQETTAPSGFHRLNGAISTTWENYVRAGPLTLATDHRDASGKLHVWFSDISVKLIGSPDWIPAQGI